MACRIYIAISLPTHIWTSPPIYIPGFLHSPKLFWTLSYSPQQQHTVQHTLQQQQPPSTYTLLRVKDGSTICCLTAVLQTLVEKASVSDGGSHCSAPFQTPSVKNSIKPSIMIKCNT
eukprot:gene837-7897_t